MLAVEVIKCCAVCFSIVDVVQSAWSEDCDENGCKIRTVKRVFTIAHRSVRSVEKQVLFMIRWFSNSILVNIVPIHNCIIKSIISAFVLAKRAVKVNGVK